MSGTCHAAQIAPLNRAVRPNDVIRANARHEEAAPAQLLAGGGQQALKQSDDEESS